MSTELMIGIFDSGIGGLTVLRALTRALPEIPITYFADFGYAPYGNRCAQEIMDRTCQILHWMKQEGVSLAVIACHTSSAVLTLDMLAQAPLPVITMLEPTLNSILMHPQNAQWCKGVGLIATALSVQKGTLVAALRQRSFSLPIHAFACPPLASLIESGQWSNALTYMQEHPLAFFTEHQVDTIVYGCTHYPFIEPWLQSTGIHYAPRLDPAEAVAVAVATIVRAHQKDSAPDQVHRMTPRAITFYHTGDLQEGRARLAQHWSGAASSQHIALPVM